MILRQIPNAPRPWRIGALALLGYCCGIGIALAQSADLPPWLSGSGRSDPFLPDFSNLADPTGILGELEPVPPIPIEHIQLGPTPADDFQALLDGGRMQGTMVLQGDTRALIRLNGANFQVLTGDTLRIGDLTLTVLEVAPEAVVFSAEDGNLVGMLPRDPTSGLQVDRSGTSLVIRSIEPAAE